MGWDEVWTKMSERRSEKSLEPFNRQKIKWESIWRRQDNWVDTYVFNMFTDTNIVPVLLITLTLEFKYFFGNLNTSSKVFNKQCSSTFEFVLFHNSSTFLNKTSNFYHQLWSYKDCRDVLQERDEYYLLFPYIYVYYNNSHYYCDYYYFTWIIDTNKTKIVLWL